MIQTLLLCFIHGFKGDDEAFYEFPQVNMNAILFLQHATNNIQDLKTSIEATSPELKVHTSIYPKYETRGDLSSCAETFREWLQDQVTDLETTANTPSAILNPSVGVVLVAHSMGGFVATDALFSILSTRPTIDGKERMFPQIVGLLTFDTPFNGLARSLFAYGAFSQYKNVSTLYNIWSSLSGGLGLQAASAAASSFASQKASTVPGNEEARSVARTVGGVPASSWKRWGLLAARTGTVGAVVAGGVTAYLHREAIGESLSKIDVKNIDYDPRSYLKKENLPNMPTMPTMPSMPSMPRSMPSLPKGMSVPGKETLVNNLPDIATLSGVSRENIGEGFAWMAGHLKFVGTLMKQEQMSARLEHLSALHGLGKCNIFTCLGENSVWSGGYFIPRRRFCAVPIEMDPVLKGKKDSEKDTDPEVKGWWVENVNGKAENEIVSHCSMFQRERNDSYENLLEISGGRIVSWVLGAGVKDVVDGYNPDQIRAAKSRAEGEWVDDDGKMKSAGDKTEEEANGGKRKASVMLGDEEPSEETAKGDQDAVGNEDEDEDEDEKQLEAIMSCQGLPQSEDGGVSDEALTAAMEIPLPGEENELSKAAAEVPLPDEVEAESDEQKPAEEEAK